MLKAEKIDLALLEAKYGFVVPHQVLQALQRDGVQGKDHVFQEDIYEKPMAEVMTGKGSGWGGGGGRLPCSWVSLSQVQSINQSIDQLNNESIKPWITMYHVVSGINMSQ